MFLVLRVRVFHDKCFTLSEMQLLCVGSLVLRASPCFFTTLFLVPPLRVLQKVPSLLNVRLFFEACQHEKNNASVECCPTDAMLRDCVTKPFHRSKKTGLRQEAISMPTTTQLLAAFFVVDL